MPSLKDLRNRIAATKATQKITKAVQMVAASKLRRAQAAAEAARPYAERMDTVLSNIAASVAGLDSAPALPGGRPAAGAAGAATPLRGAQGQGFEQYRRVGRGPRLGARAPARQRQG